MLQITSELKNENSAYNKLCFRKLWLPVTLSVPAQLQSSPGPLAVRAFPTKQQQVAGWSEDTAVKAPTGVAATLLHLPGHCSCRSQSPGEGPVGLGCGDPST